MRLFKKKKDQVYCPHCGAEINEPDPVFCPTCGLRLREEKEEKETPLESKPPISSPQISTIKMPAIQIKALKMPVPKSEKEAPSLDYEPELFCGIVVLVIILVNIFLYFPIFRL